MRGDSVKHMISPAHLYVSRQLILVVTECGDPLRQFYQAKEGVEVISTCTASEWCVDDGAKHGLHDYPPLDQTSPQRSMHAPEFIGQLCCVPKIPS